MKRVLIIIALAGAFILYSFYPFGFWIKVETFGFIYKYDGVYSIQYSTNKLMWRSIKHTLINYNGSKNPCFSQDFDKVVIFAKTFKNMNDVKKYNATQDSLSKLVKSKLSKKWRNWQ